MWGVSPILLPFFWSPHLQQMNGNGNAQDPRDPVAGALQCRTWSSAEAVHPPKKWQL